MIFEQIRVAGDRNFGYLVGDDAARLAAIVDAGYAPEKMLDAAESRGLKVAYVISTHSHKDHIVGNAWLVERTGAPEVLHETAPAPSAGGAAIPDADAPHVPAHGGSTVRVKDNDELAVGSLRLRFLHTPGHIPDHVCILVAPASRRPFGLERSAGVSPRSAGVSPASSHVAPASRRRLVSPQQHSEGPDAPDQGGTSAPSQRKLLTGDLLFVGKIGGTGPHFRGSDPRQEWDSLQRLIRLGQEDPAIEVWPGHDYGTQPSSTLGREIATNPFLLCKTYEDFLHLKDHWAEYKKAHGIA